MKVEETSTGHIYTLEPAYSAVTLELTARGDRNRNVRFQKVPDGDSVKGLVVVH